MENEEVIEIRKEKIIQYFKSSYDWLVYLVLALIVWLSVKIRLSNLPGLRDVTTGGYTLGPDLDPFLFLRWAKEIVATGSLAAIDTMRYVPLGFDTRGELVLLSYLIAWFHNIAGLFGSTSIEQSAVIFPAVMFGLTIIAFFILVRKMFIDSYGENKSNIIALLSSFFLSVIPSLLPRTIAGIPEKESVAFLFMFLAFYFFLSSWKSKTKVKLYSFALLSGISTALMALVWGGYIYVLLTLGIALLVSFLFEQIDKNKLIIIITWIISSILIMNQFSTRYSFQLILTSTTTLIPLAVLGIILVNFVIFNTKIGKYIEGTKLSVLPKPLITLLILFVLGIIFALISTFIFNSSFVTDKIGDITKPLITPISDRLGVTVAENRQPYFAEWAGSFGPYLMNNAKLPLFFWLFFIGAIYLYSVTMNIFPKKERTILTLSYMIFLLAIIFSRYDPNSTLNGTNLISIAVYFLGILFLLMPIGYYYIRDHKLKNTEKFRKIDFGIIILLSLFFFSIISARGAVRLIMVLVAPISILVSFMAVNFTSNALKVKDDLGKIISWVLIALLISSTIYSGYIFYQASKGSAQGYVPSSYTQQWQKAMAWVRDNTQENAVFAHWWDYGYWIQSIGNRATVLDGGNYIAYWNHLMGRHALTGSSNQAALELLYTHNVTHFLIDSTDIGKYAAFSSIGGDENYDRESWINTFVKDYSQSQEKKNSTVYIYSGGTALDEDITYIINGTKVFLPGVNDNSSRRSSVAYVGAIIIEKDNLGNIVNQPEAIFVYQNNQYRLPLRYVYNSELIDYGKGVESGVFLFPSINAEQGGYSIDNSGALLYLSRRTVNSQLARLYLYDEKNSNFILAHTQDDELIAQIKAQNPEFDNDFLFYQGFRGPIKIWQVKYPSNIKTIPQYLNTTYPDVRLTIAR